MFGTTLPAEEAGSHHQAHDGVSDGGYIDCDDDEAYHFFMGLVETNSFRFAELGVWLQEHVKPIDG